MTKDEITVLNYVDANLGGPSSIRADLRPTYRSLMERGFIETVTIYRLTVDGDVEVRLAEASPQS